MDLQIPRMNKKLPVSAMETGNKLSSNPAAYPTMYGKTRNSYIMLLGINPNSANEKNVTNASVAG